MTPEKIKHLASLCVRAETDASFPCLKLAGHTIIAWEPTAIARDLQALIASTIEHAIRLTYASAFDESESDRDAFSLLTDRRVKRLKIKDRLDLADLIDRLRAQVAHLASDNGYNDGYAAGLAFGKTLVLQVTQSSWLPINRQAYHQAEVRESLDLLVKYLESAIASTFDRHQK